jgi:putative endonuclease
MPAFAGMTTLGVVRAFQPVIPAAAGILPRGGTRCVAAATAARRDGMQVGESPHHDTVPRVPCVYIMTNRPRGVLYIGVTSRLQQRVWQHRTHAFPGFTSRYRLIRLVWFEVHQTMCAAITREKQIKKWVRSWKLDLVETANHDWRDLGDEWFGTRAGGVTCRSPLSWG